MDDGIVTSSNCGFHCFLVQWKGHPSYDVSWITKDEFRVLDLEFLEWYLQTNYME